MENARQEILHASCVALNAENAVLILGPSGAGKSTLALQLMAYGAHLVADDRVLLRAVGPDVIASAPESIAGLIEARGVGILNAAALPSARIRLVVDLSRDETERLPPMRETNLLDRFLPLVLRLQHGHLDLAVLQWLKGGRHA